MEESKGTPQPREEVSKSQRRRDALEVKSLAARLIELPAARLDQMPLAGQLRAEIERARTIRAHGARKRQLQYVAKLLRRDDPEPLLAALDAFENEARQLNARHHRSEAWRDRLLEGDDAVVGVLLEQRRDADAQAIRQLLRNARRATAKGTAPTAARALFRVLRELDETEPLPPLP